MRASPPQAGPRPSRRGFTPAQVCVGPSIGSASEKDEVTVLRMADRKAIEINRETAASFKGEIGGDTLQVRAAFQTRDHSGYRNNPVGRDGDDDRNAQRGARDRRGVDRGHRLGDRSDRTVVAEADGRHRSWSWRDRHGCRVHRNAVSLRRDRPAAAGSADHHAIGASDHAAARAALSAVNMLQPAPQASIAGRTERVDMASAALINGITSHTFDFDDTHLKTIIHPAGPVASALMALAVAWFLAREVFDFSWQLPWWSVPLGAALAATVAALVGQWTLRSVLRQSVTQTLRQSES